jgi:hypothetical protein
VKFDRKSNRCPAPIGGAFPASDPIKPELPAFAIVLPHQMIEKRAKPANAPQK